MAIFQSDLSIKTAIELGIEDIRENLWLIDDILGDAVNNPYLKDKYGQKQIDACKEWFKNNQIDIYMVDRNDKDRFPCVTITLGTSNEKDEMKHMADQSTESVILLPNKINKPIPYVVKPFTITSYDIISGEVVIDQDTTNITAVAAGMILVDPTTGNGYVINEVIPEGIVIESGLTLGASVFGIVPQHQFYKARIEHSFFQETYNIGCHVVGDQQTLLWLHSIVLYSLLRYREGLLEANGFSQSTINSSDLMANPAFSGPGGEKAWSRFISLTGMVENSWIKSPRRYIEKISLKEKTNTGFIGGIKILSNLDSPEFVDKENENWYTTEDSDDESS
jgi:hypothetical protein